jgi:hypothetical protein
MVESNKEGSATLRAVIKAELKQALEAVEEAMTKRDKAAEDMFQLYANLMSVNARYAWNKIVQEQTNADPYTDLQGLTRKGPRGMSCKSFEDCVTFHLLTMFPNNATEQERYYLLIAPELLTIWSKRICPESCFFVFTSIRVPMYRTYVICTREHRNISLIEDQLQ